MRFPVVKLVLSAFLLYFSHAALAASGGPIGGIVVKGGKNPGGQMHVMATTDAAGKFKIEFAEGGDYKLEFVGRTGKDSDARVGTDMELEYLFRPLHTPPTESREKAPDASRHTPFHNKIQDSHTVITVPSGGAEVSGTLQSLSPSVKQTAGRSINESGVSVKSTPKTSSVKH